MNLSSKSKIVLGILLIIGVILIISLFNIIQKQSTISSTRITPSTWITYTSSPYAMFSPHVGPTGFIRSTPFPTLPATFFVNTPKEPPECKFPLPQTTATESTPEEYIFLQPKIVLRPNPNDAELNFISWLPDNQHVLLVQDFRDASQNIETLNTQTGKVKIYSHQAFNRPPVWVAGLDAVVYPQTLYLSPDIYDSNGVRVIPTAYDVKRQLLLSQADPTNIQTIEDTQLTIYTDRPNADGDIFNIIVNTDGNEIAYFDDWLNNLYLRKVSQGTLGKAQLSAFDIKKWAFPLGANFGFAAKWRSNSTQIFVYGNSSRPGIYTYLLDTQSGQICKINLYKSQALANSNGDLLRTAIWSPNGRYLAVSRQDGAPLSSPTDLIVLDTATGKLYQMDAVKFSPAGTESLAGSHNVGVVAWAPDNRHILVVGGFFSFPRCNQNCFGYTNLYLADFITEQIESILPAQQFGMAMWSPDGTKILATCKNEGLCLVSVQEKTQP